MKILVLNSGSSSVKYQMIDPEKSDELFIAIKEILSNKEYKKSFIKKICLLLFIPDIFFASSMRLTANLINSWVSSIW